MSYSYDIIIQIITSSGTIVALVALGYQIFRDRKEKKWEQAYRVCCWLDSTKYLRKQIKNPDYLALVVISNESKQPIYDAKVFIQRVIGSEVDSSNDDEYKYVQCIPPGEFAIFLPPPDFGMHRQFNAAIGFRDARGNYWVRNAIGVVEKSNSNKENWLIHMPEEPEHIERIK